MEPTWRLMMRLLVYSWFFAGFIVILLGLIYKNLATVAFGLIFCLAVGFIYVYTDRKLNKSKREK
jgi:hypothetical protein